MALRVPSAGTRSFASHRLSSTKGFYVGESVRHPVSSGKNKLWCRQPTKDKLGAWNYSRRLHGDGLARVRAKLVADLEKHRSQSFRWTRVTRIFQKRASTEIACTSTARALSEAGSLAAPQAQSSC